MTAHQLIMLKPMRPGVSGYARLHCEDGRAVLHLHTRGLHTRTIRIFRYSGGDCAELGRTPVDPRGEAHLHAALPPDARLAPERLQALFVLDADTPDALLVGLCARQSAGCLLDAKNAALALCDRLQRQQHPSAVGPSPAAPAPISPADDARPPLAPACHADAPSADPAPAQPPHSDASPAQAPPQPPAAAYVPPAQDILPRIPREIFLPAIDRCLPPAPRPPAADDASPAPLTAEPASVPDHGCEPSALPPAACDCLRGAPPDPTASSRGVGLRSLRWPAGFERLQPYFDNELPCAPFDLPGWRFVRVRGQPLWLGMLRQDGRVTRIAYALQAAQPPSDGPYRPVRGRDGALYQVLWQQV